MVRTGPIIGNEAWQRPQIDAPIVTHDRRRLAGIHHGGEDIKASRRRGPRRAALVRWEEEAEGAAVGELAEDPHASFGARVFHFGADAGHGGATVVP